MKGYKVIINNRKLKDDEIDGDWFMCPNCECKSCIVKSFRYCPMCAEEVNIQEVFE